jgi:hypothetical protein
MAEKVDLVKYSSNPFWDELRKSGKIHCKEDSIKSKEDFTNQNTGEVISVNRVTGHTYTIKDNRQFAKIYNEDSLLNLSQTGYVVFHCVTKMMIENYSLSSAEIKQTDHISFKYSDYVRITGKEGKASYYGGIRNLCENKIVALGEAPTLLYINPMIFFVGNTMRYISDWASKDYYKEKKLVESKSKKYDATAGIKSYLEKNNSNGQE